MNLSIEETTATKAFESAARLLNQIFEWRSPGDYSFESDFPEEFATWISAADTFSRSDKRELRRYGLLMREFARKMTELDRTPKDTFKFRIRLAAFRRTVDRLTSASKSLAEKVVLADV